MLNGMASPDFEEALDRHASWGVRYLDLKDCIFGKSITQLEPLEISRARDLIRQSDLQVYCLSTGVLGGEIEKGEEICRTQLDDLDRALAAAIELRPRFIRLLAAQTTERGRLSNAIPYVRDRHPWLIDLYREAIDRIQAAGFEPTIENEVDRCIVSSAEEFLDLRTAIDRPTLITWDVQNLWQMGVFPTLEVYDQLRHAMGYLHLKGGQCSGGSREMRWGCTLEDASYPAVEILRAVVRDAVSPVICLNPPHGKLRPGDSYEAILQSDLAFVRAIAEEQPS